MSNKNKKRVRKSKENVEEKNLYRIQEVKNEDRIKRTNKNAKKSKERTEKQKNSNSTNENKRDLYKEVINGKDLLKEVTDDTKESKNKEIENKVKKSKKLKKHSKNNLYDMNCKKVLSNKLVISARVILCIVFIFLIILIYLAVRPKFKDITIELGTTDLSANSFLVSQIYKNGASLVTDLSTIDLLKVQEIDIVLDFKGKQETVKLNIIDTTAPIVEFKDMMAYLDYVPNPDDFIASKKDFSEMKVEFVEIPEFTNYGRYSTVVKVSDAYGNETIGTCDLIITWLIQEVDLELGSEFSVANIVIDVDRFGALVPETELAKVNTMALGTYEINVTIDGETYTSKVVVQDTTPPDLQLQNITIWDDETVNGYESFIISASDISGEVATESSTVIDYSVMGDQSIVIKATDVNGNVNEQTAILTIKHDTTGPKIYGLSNLTVNKHSEVNYESGVYAIDDKDGNTTFTVDSSSVNTSAAGTYYATYSAIDKAGNTSSYRRKITVNWDSEDVNQKVNEFYNNYCAGQSAAGITQVVYNRIKYTSSSYGSREANIYYGLTNGRGNCFVHAYILQALINKSGSSCAVVWLADGSHCWNKVGNVHYDSTPGGRHLLQANSDEEKLAEPWFSGKSYTADQFIISY